MNLNDKSDEKTKIMIKKLNPENLLIEQSHIHKAANKKHNLP